MFESWDDRDSRALLLRVLATMGPRDWAETTLVPRICVELEGAAEASHADATLEVMVLSNLRFETRLAKRALKALVSLKAKALEAADVSFVAYSLGICAMDKDRTKSEVADLCRKIPTVGANWKEVPAGLTFRFYFTAGSPLDGSVTKEVVAYIDSSEPSVQERRETARLLGVLGFSISDRVAELCRILTKYGDDQLSLTIAGSVVLVANASHLPALRRARAQTKSDPVASELDVAITSARRNR